MEKKDKWYLLLVAFSAGRLPEAFPITQPMITKTTPSTANPALMSRKFTIQVAVIFKYIVIKYDPNRIYTFNLTQNLN
jgi:hypothetical protein